MAWYLLDPVLLERHEAAGQGGVHARQIGLWDFGWSGSGLLELGRESLEDGPGQGFDLHRRNLAHSLHCEGV